MIKMDGEAILNRFEYIRKTVFSESIKLSENEEIYFVFRAEIVSLKPNPKRSYLNRTIDFIKREKKSKLETKVSSVLMNPIAYIIKFKEGDSEKLHLKEIHNEHHDFVMLHKPGILKEFRKELKNRGQL